MRVLVTNDDGIRAEGLMALADSLSVEHEVWLFAPDQERSGISHAMTLRNPGKVRKLGEREFSCSGTPADCVLLACLGALPFSPEAVVSGINRGPNLGTDIIYSGTCGAARQAALNGLPGIAVSCASYREPMTYTAAAAFVAGRFGRLVELCDGSTFINVNAPSSDSTELPALWTLPCKRRYRDKLKSFDGPDGFAYCFLADGTIETIEEEWTDNRAIAAGRISVSPILVHPQVRPGYRPGMDFC
jgi:5'-nucleotidase